VVSYEGNEYGGFELVHARSGKFIAVESMPIVGPDRKTFVITEERLDPSWQVGGKNQVQVGTVTDDSILIDGSVEWTDWAATNVRWISPDLFRYDIIRRDDSSYIGYANYVKVGLGEATRDSLGHWVFVRIP
jgi:hypothetical protein